MATSFLLQANGDYVLQADGVSKIILAIAAAPVEEVPDPYRPRKKSESEDLFRRKSSADVLLRAPGQNVK